MHGVRQLAPSEVFASAPGGSDSIVSETLAPRENDPMLGTQSQLGVQLEQPASSSAPATALARNDDPASVGIRTTSSPAIPRPHADVDITARLFDLQDCVAAKSGGGKAAT